MLLRKRFVFQYRQQSCCISLKQRRIRSIVQAFRHQEKRHRLAYYAKAYLFQHWTHSNNNTMWYDRETQKLINPHFDGSVMFFLDDETIIYKGLNHTWIYDTNSMKKKCFFSNKDRNKIIEMVGMFFDIPKEHINKYTSSWTKIELNGFENGRLYFKCFLDYFEESSSLKMTKEIVIHWGFHQ